jgi:hypothetical protein
MRLKVELRNANGKTLKFTGRKQKLSGSIPGVFDAASFWFNFNYPYVGGGY